jgi:hypothetical protein
MLQLVINTSSFSEENLSWSTLRLRSFCIEGRLLASAQCANRRAIGDKLAKPNEMLRLTSLIFFLFSRWPSRAFQRTTEGSAMGDHRGFFIADGRAGGEGGELLMIVSIRPL